MLTQTFLDCSGSGVLRVKNSHAVLCGLNFVKYSSWSCGVLLVWKEKNMFVGCRGCLMMMTGVICFSGWFLSIVSKKPLQICLRCSSTRQHRSDVHRTNTIHNHREIRLDTTIICYQDSKRMQSACLKSLKSKKKRKKSVK